MIVYHGSDIFVPCPDVSCSQKHLDFGAGFYTTSVQAKAERWAKRKAALHGKTAGYISVYDYAAVPGFTVRDFAEDMYAWIDFVCQCRSGSDIFRCYDIITGKVADDKVFRVVDMYMRKIIDKDRAIREIKAYETYSQTAFVTQAAVNSSLTFKDCYEVKL